MKRTCFFGTTLALLLVANAPAGADLVPWTYNWTSTVAFVAADGNTGGKITMTNEPGASAQGDSDIVATNLKVFSSADPNHPDTITHGVYGLDLTITDTTSHTSGVLHFTGELDGTISASSSLITNTFTSLISQAIPLGGNLYTVTIGPFTPPAPPGAQNYGSISATASVTVQPIQNSPEPSTLALAGVGVVFLGGLTWRKRQAARKLVWNLA